MRDYREYFEKVYRDYKIISHFKDLQTHNQKVNDCVAFWPKKHVKVRYDCRNRGKRQNHKDNLGNISRIQNNEAHDNSFEVKRKMSYWKNEMKIHYLV